MILPTGNHSLAKNLAKGYGQSLIAKVWWPNYDIGVDFTQIKIELLFRIYDTDYDMKILHLVCTLKFTECNEPSSAWFNTPKIKKNGVPVFRDSCAKKNVMTYLQNIHGFKNNLFCGRETDFLQTETKEPWT